MFLILAIFLIGLWKLAWPIGTARGQNKSETDKDILERFVFPVFVAIVIALITDIDTPQGGLISLDKHPLLELTDKLNGSSTARTPGGSQSQHRILSTSISVAEI